MNEILYTTDDLSKMFRVGKSTIKRWTDEGKLQCFKTPGGHRKFKPSNVQEFIIHYHYEVSATELPDGALNADSVSAAFGPNVEECFASAVKGLRQPIEHSFSALFAQGKSLPVIFDSFLTPLLRMIHTKHLRQLITSVELQITKNTLTHSLIHFADQIPKSQKKNLELYCLSVHEGMNEVELKAVELLLDNMGMTVYNLGTVLTKYAANDIVGQCKPEDVFVVLSLNNSSDDVIQQFNSLVSGVKSYGGNVYTSNFFEEQQTDSVVPTDSNLMHSFSEIVERIVKAERSTVTLSL